MGGKKKSKRFFDKFDTDKDGAVTIEEFSKIVKRQPQKKGKKTKREHDEEHGNEHKDGDDDNK